MKKVFVLVLTCMLLAIMCIPALAAEELQVGKAVVLPAIDGNLGDVEWKDAKIYRIDVETANKVGFNANLSMSNDGIAQADVFSMWDQKGLYGAAIVKDPNVVYSPMNAGEALNVCDGIQLLFDPMNAKNGGVDIAYIFDFVPASGADQKGPAIWFEHWQYNAMDNNAGIQVAGKIVDGGYELEWFIPWTALQTNDEKIDVKAGTKIGYGMILMDFSGKDALKELIVTFGEGQNMIGAPAGYQTIVLSDKAVGGKKAAETKATETKAAETKTTSNPKTGDAGTVIYVFAAGIALASGTSFLTAKKVRK